MSTFGVEVLGKMPAAAKVEKKQWVLLVSGYNYVALRLQRSSPKYFHKMFVYNLRIYNVTKTKNATKCKNNIREIIKFKNSLSHKI